MTISRRKFITAGTMLGISAALPLAALAQAGKKPVSVAAAGGSPGGGDVLARLTQSDFARQLNTSFGIRLSARIAWKVELYQVIENKAGTAQGLHNFSVFFRGLHDNPLGQNTYRFEHPQLGAFDLFISPAGSSGKMKAYEAVFNRL